MNTIKFCTRCKLDKDAKLFRLRKEKRRGGLFYYLNNTCRECDAGIAREYYKKVKDSEEFKLKNKKRVNVYRINNKEIIRDKNKTRRKKECYKENRKKYIARNKEKISEQEKVCKRRWHEKNRDGLTDVYVCSKIIAKTTLSRRDIPHELIELKRLQLMCY